MSDDKKEKVIEIIKKLMLKDEHATEGCEEERNAALAKVQELIIKYRITDEDLEESEKEEKVKITSSHIFMDSAPWVRVIFGYVARMNFCKYLYITSKVKPTKATHYVYGRELEVELTIKLVEAIVKNIARQARYEAKLRPYDRSFQRSFLNSAAQRIAIRCDDMVEKAKKITYEQTSGQFLTVIADQYYIAEKQNAEYIKSQYETVKTKKPIHFKNYSREGSIRGDAYGKTVKIKEE